MCVTLRCRTQTLLPNDCHKLMFYSGYLVLFRALKARPQSMCLHQSEILNYLLRKRESRTFVKTNLNLYARLEFQQRKVLTEFALTLLVRSRSRRWVCCRCWEAVLPSTESSGAQRCPRSPIRSWRGSGVDVAVSVLAASHFYFFA